ncbi:EF-hand calcium-binding domain-containing protein 3 isoform X1 [Antechinus flavipes]|uniref:EF-hand calcium-binding domain-containing protein 3 isoform X1 n=2 Tax=Antechinus flavipes TaxID=38775 RepID=UPI002236AE93|nr:EF-hand calcium-binding domain-containing protein 3 isoform X1 [Antechinus flavipes]
MNALQNLKGGKINVDNLHKVLGKKGIQLTDKEMEELLSNLPVDADGNVALNEVLDKVKSIEENIDTQNLKDFLKDMGIILTEDDYQDLLKILPIDDNGKANLKDLINALQNLKGGKININNLDKVLEKLGIQLTDKEMEELLSNLPVDADENVALNEVMDQVKYIKENIDAQNEKDLLKDLGIILTEEEYQDLIKDLPIDANGKVNLKDLMNALQNLKGGKINIDNLDKVLGEMGIQLTDKEMEELLSNQPVDADGNVALNEVMNKVKYIEENIDAYNLKDFLKDMGIRLTEDEYEDLLKDLLIDANGKVNLKDLMNSLQNPKGGKINIDNLDEVLGKMGIQLTDKEMEKLLSNLPVDDDGNVPLNRVMNKMKYIKESTDDQNTESFLKDMKITFKKNLDFLKHLSIDAKRKMKPKKMMNVRQIPRGRNIDIDSLDKGLGTVKIKLTDRETTGAPTPPRDKLLSNLPVEENLEDFLKEIGISSTQVGRRDLLKHLPIDAKKKVKPKKIMNARQNLRERNVDINNLDKILGDLGIKFTDREIKELLSNLPVDGFGRVNLNQLLNNIKSIKENIDARNLEHFLKDMGITLKKDKYQDFLKHLPVDHQGKIIKKDIMIVVKTLGIGVDVDNLDKVLENLEIKLTDREIEELLDNLPIKDNGKVYLNEVIDNVKSVKENIDVQNLEDFLKDMGITLTKDEHRHILKRLPIDSSGKVHRNNLMNFLKYLKGIKVDVHELDNVLRNLGIDLTDQQLQELLTLLPLECDGKVDLNKLIEYSKSIKNGVTSQMSASSDTKLKYKLKPLTKIPSTHIRGKDFPGFLQDHIKHKERLTQGQLEAFLEAFESFDKDESGCIDLHGLQSSAAKLGIELTNQETQDELEFADIDRDGKLNFSDFLTVLTDDDRFIQAVVPDTDPNSDLVDSTGILLFEMLSKLVETSALPRKHMIDIVCYYRKKYHDAASRPLWRRYDAGVKKRRKSRRESITQQGTSTSAFADASRIAIMSEKDLLKFLEELKRCSPHSDSPYAKIPIFPLFPNMDGTVVGKPFKDLQRLEVLRKREPLQFFEDYFFHKKNWKAQAASFKPLENSDWPEEIINIDHIMKKKRQWSVAEAACLRQQVKKGIDAYHLGVALGHRKDMLNFWRKIRGDLIGLESGNESFYDTFSTYTWSWNVCQELLSTKDLKLYDARSNRYSHARALFSSFPYITEGNLELGRKRKRKRCLRGQTQ